MIGTLIYYGFYFLKPRHRVVARLLFIVLDTALLNVEN